MIEEEGGRGQASTMSDEKLCLSAGERRKRERERERDRRIVNFTSLTESNQIE